MLGRASELVRERESKLLRLGAMSDTGDRAEMSYKRDKKEASVRRAFFFLERIIMQKFTQFNWPLEGNLQMIVDKTQMIP